MAEYYPSEIARLVLGYLKEVNCPKAWGTFLVESVDLQEHYRLLQNGRSCSTNIEGKSLLEILHEYRCLKDAARRDTRNQISSSLGNLNVSCADLKSNTINPNVSCSEGVKILKENNAEAFYNSDTIHQTTQSQATIHFAQAGNKSPWSVQARLFTSTQSHLSRMPRRLKRVCVRALDFETERNEKPMPVHSGGFEPSTRHACVKPSVRETIASQRYCHSNLLEREPTMLSRMIQTETSQIVVDNRSCQMVSYSPSQKRLLEKSSNECPHRLTTSKNSTKCTAKDQLQSSTESRNFSNKSDMEEKQNNSRSVFPENVTSDNNEDVNQAIVSTSTKLGTTVNNESSTTPPCDSEPPPYSRTSSTNSPRRMLSCNRTQVSSLTTPMKDRRQCTEECSSPTLKDTFPRRLLNEFPHPKQRNSNESSFVTIHENVESTNNERVEKDRSNQAFTQRLTDITTDIEDPGASNSSSFPTMQDIQNFDLDMQNILARDDSLFNDLSSLYSNSRDCDNLTTQKSIETSEETFSTKEDTGTSKDKCEQAIIKTNTSKSEIDSTEQHDNTQERNEQLCMNETNSQLSPSRDVPLASNSVVGQNTSAAVEVPESLQVVNNKTNLTQVSGSNNGLGFCMSFTQPNAEHQFQNCNLDQNGDHADSVIDVQSIASNLNKSSTIVCTSVTENMKTFNDVSALKPVSIGTPFEVGTERVPKTVGSINQSIPTTQTIVCCPLSSVTNNTLSCIPNNKNISVLPAVQDQGFILNSNFHVSPISQFCYASSSGFPIKPFDGFQPKFVIVQQSHSSHNMNTSNWTNNKLKNVSIPVQIGSAESTARLQSCLANNVVAVTSETAQAKKARNSPDKKKRQKVSKKKSTCLKNKISCKSSLCSPLKSAEYVYGKKKSVTKEMTSDFVTNAIEKLTAHKTVSSSLSDIVLNVMQDALEMKSMKRKRQNSSVVNLSPVKKTPPKCSPSDKKTVVSTDKFIPKSSFDSDSESDNIPLSAIALKLKSALKVEETETFDHKQNNSRKSNLAKETGKNVEEIFSSTNTCSLKSNASNRIKSKALNTFQEATSKEIGNIKYTQSHISSKVPGNSPSNPIVLGSDEDTEMSEIGNENVASQMMCSTKSKSSKKEQIKKCKRKKHPKLTLPSKRKTLSRKNVKRTNSSASQISNLATIIKTGNNFLQNEKPDSLTEKSNYKESQENCIKKILCDKKSENKHSDRSHKLKDRTNINETNDRPLSNDETDFPSSQNEYRTTQDSATEKEQKSGQKDELNIPSHQKEVNQPSSFENNQYSLRTKKSRNIDELCDKLRLNAIQSSPCKKETLTKVDKLPNTVVRNLFEVPANETSLQHEPLLSERTVPINNKENGRLELASVKILDEKSITNAEVLNNILNFDASNSFKQSSSGDQPVKRNVKRLVLPPKKRIRPVPFVSPCDSFSPFSSPAHAVCFDSTLKPKDISSVTKNPFDSDADKIVSCSSELDSSVPVVCFDSTSRPEEMPPFARKISNAEINEIISSHPKLISSENVICFNSSSKPQKIPSLSPVDDEVVKKCSSGKPKAATEFFKSALSNREDNLPVSLDSKPSSFCMVETFLSRKNPLELTDTFKTSPNKENCPVNKISCVKKKSKKEGQKRKLALTAIRNPLGEILIPPSFPSSQVQPKDKKPKCQLKKNFITQKIPAGVKIPPDWTNSIIKSYSSTIARIEDEVGSKVPRRSRPNIKIAGFKSSFKANSSFNKKTEHLLDLSKQPKSS
ncbi:unnamed protein product [Larinioides sclopetarius]|uniref:LisH domain-containing protein n=1 Tax=Larinioides sclopetarius TaxID=280406 RepID=A0AAV2AVW3_9ARAC